MEISRFHLGVEPMSIPEAVERVFYRRLVEDDALRIGFIDRFLEDELLEADHDQRCTAQLMES